MDDVNVNEVFKKILDPKFQFDDWDMEQFVAIGQEAVSVKTLNQRLLGRLALALETEYGQQNIPEFAKQVNLAPKTIYSYRNVEKTLDGLDVPEDLLWSGRVWLVNSGDPKKYLKILEDEGLTSAQLVRKIKEDLGKVTDKKKCPKCGTALTHIECPHCKAALKI